MDEIVSPSKEKKAIVVWPCLQTQCLVHVSEHELLQGTIEEKTRKA